MGACSLIEMQSKDKNGVLTIAARQGEYEGMQKEREFILKLPGEEATIVSYCGREVSISAKSHS